MRQVSQHHFHLAIPRLPELVMLFLMVTLTGCDLVGDVLEFGFWTLLILVLVVGGLAVWIFKRLF